MVARLDQRPHATLVRRLVPLALRQRDPGAPAQKQARKPPKRPAAGSEAVSFFFAVKLDRVLDGDQLLLEFVKQYHELGSDAEAAEAIRTRHWHWRRKPARVTAAHVRQGYIRLPVYDDTLTATTSQEHQERKGQKCEFNERAAPLVRAAVARCPPHSAIVPHRHA